MDAAAETSTHIHIHVDALADTGIQFGIHVASIWMLPRKPALTYSQSPFWASTMEISFLRCFHMNTNWGYQYAVWKPEKDLGESNIRGEKKVGIEPS